MIDSKKIDSELREIFALLNELGFQTAAEPLKYTFMYERFTTGNEWLEEIEFKLGRILEGAPELPADIVIRIERMISEINDWLLEARRSVIKYDPRQES